MGGLVEDVDPPAGQRAGPRGGGADALQPVRCGDAIGVEEGETRRRRLCHSAIARRGGSFRGFDDDTDAGMDGLDPVQTGGRSVVDDDRLDVRADLGGERLEAPGEPRRILVMRHDHGDLGGLALRSRHRHLAARS